MDLIALNRQALSLINSPCSLHITDPDRIKHTHVTGILKNFTILYFEDDADYYRVTYRFEGDAQATSIVYTTTAAEPLPHMLEFITI